MPAENRGQHLGAASRSIGSPTEGPSVHRRLFFFSLSSFFPLPPSDINVGVDHKSVSMKLRARRGARHSKEKRGGRKWPPSSVKLFTETVEQRLLGSRPGGVPSTMTGADDACRGIERALIQSFGESRAEPDQTKKTSGGGTLRFAD